MSPWPKNVALRILAGVWSSPAAILGFIVALVLLAFKQVSSAGWSQGAWDLVARDNTWLGGYRKQWGGFSVGWCVFYLASSQSKDPMTRTHERVHLRQQLILGIIHWLFYVLFIIVVWLACRSLHSYAANPFELDARIQSGDKIGNLGPEPGNDRWPWF